MPTFYNVFGEFGRRGLIYSFHALISASKYWPAGTQNWQTWLTSNFSKERFLEHVAIFDRHEPQELFLEILAEALYVSTLENLQGLVDSNLVIWVYVMFLPDTKRLIVSCKLSP